MSWFSLFGGIFYVFGTFITALNFDLGFLRYGRHRRRGVTDDEYRHVSGIPVVGSLFLYSVFNPLEKLVDYRLVAC